MEPTLPTPHGSPEIGPPAPLGPFGPEIGSPGNREKFNQTPERPAPQEVSRGPSQSAPPMPAITIPSADPITATTQQTQPDPATPLVAADEDLIEKEWVERAKRVISETKHDPHAQERAISQLQADYLHKRYGKVIKLPSEE